MALDISIETGYGIPATYWKITKIDEKFQGNVTIELAGYVSEAARLAEMNPLQTRYFTFDDINNVTRDVAYTRIKQSEIVDEIELNPFAIAEDI